MDAVQRTERRGVLNEITMTLHRHQVGAAEYRTACGHLHHVDHEQVRIVGIDRATEDLHASKCGNCFDDGGGY